MAYGMNPIQYASRVLPYRIGCMLYDTNLM